MPVTINGTSGITGNSGTVISASTIGVGGATPSGSGAGITFPATQSASSNANTLDDYEEGTWTPTVVPSSGGSITLKNIQARYTKIGNTVNLQLSAQVASFSSPSGRLGISGLPFTGNSFPSGCYLGINGFSSFAGSTGGLIEGGATANLDRYNNGSIASDLANYAQVDGYIFFFSTYFVS